MSINNISIPIELFKLFEKIVESLFKEGCNSHFSGSNKVYVEYKDCSKDFERAWELIEEINRIKNFLSAIDTTTLPSGIIYENHVWNGNYWELDESKIQH